MQDSRKRKGMICDLVLEINRDSSEKEQVR